MKIYVCHFFRKSGFLDRFGKYNLAYLHRGAFANDRKHDMCNACMNALYFSKKREVKHWKVHKRECKNNRVRSLIILCSRIGTE